MATRIVRKITTVTAAAAMAAVLGFGIGSDQSGARAIAPDGERAGSAQIALPARADVAALDVTVRVRRHELVDGVVAPLVPHFLEPPPRNRRRIMHAQSVNGSDPNYTLRHVEEALVTAAGKELLVQQVDEVVTSARYRDEVAFLQIDRKQTRDVHGRH